MLARGLPQAYAEAVSASMLPWLECHPEHTWQAARQVGQLVRPCSVLMVVEQAQAEGSLLRTLRPPYLRVTAARVLHTNCQGSRYDWSL